MPDNPLHGILLSDFNVASLAGYLANDPDQPTTETIVAPFGQVLPVLLSAGHDVWHGCPDFAVVWTRPEGVIESFHRLAQHLPGTLEDTLREVDDFAALLVRAAGRVRTLLVPTWTPTLPRRGLGMLDLRPGLGLAGVLAQMNLRLAQGCVTCSNIYVLDANRWLFAAGRTAFNPTLWYMAKVPFGHEIFKEASRDIKSALLGVMGGARKLVILDLDETLWGGIVGDIGWNNLRLGGHDPVGEAYLDFQRELKALSRRGVVLAIVSKNEESVALEAIRRNPEMILRLEDFVGWKINWGDKAQNIVDLVAGLNLGLHSAVFIDDHPTERARVRDALPEVLVPDWPDDPALFSRTLVSLRCFDMPAISREDATRTQLYAADRQRESLRKTVGSLDEWLRSLDMKITIEELNGANLARTVQLLNKTNQMNLTTRRMTEGELLAWVREGGRKLWTFRVADKYGDAGLTGVLAAELGHETAIVTDFVLSCRVMGRKVEETMLSIAVQHARDAGLKRVLARFVPTERNSPCLEFFRRSGFRCEDTDTFLWSAADDFPAPACVVVERRS